MEEAGAQEGEKSVQEGNKIDPLNKRAELRIVLLPPENEKREKKKQGRRRK